MAHRGQILVDMRGFDTALKRPFLLALVDKMVEFEAQDQMLLISDHEPSAITAQIDLRKESRGKFECSCEQRSDGAWVAFVRPRRPLPSPQFNNAGR